MSWLCLSSQVVVVVSLGRCLGLCRCHQRRRRRICGQRGRGVHGVAPRLCVEVAGSLFCLVRGGVLQLCADLGGWWLGVGRPAPRVFFVVKQSSTLTMFLPTSSPNRAPNMMFQISPTARRAGCISAYCR